MSLATATTKSASGPGGVAGYIGAVGTLPAKGVDGTTNAKAGLCSLTAHTASAALLVPRGSGLHSPRATSTLAPNSTVLGSVTVRT